MEKDTLYRINGTAVDEKCGQTTSQLIRLEESIQEMCKVFGLVEERLSQVLFESVEKRVGDREEETELPIVPIASRVRSSVEAVQSHTRKLRNLLDRIEL